MTVALIGIIDCLTYKSLCGSQGNWQLTLAVMFDLRLHAKSPAQALAIAPAISDHVPPGRSKKPCGRKNPAQWPPPTPPRISNTEPPEQKKRTIQKPKQAKPRTCSGPNGRGILAVNSIAGRVASPASILGNRLPYILHGMPGPVNSTVSPLPHTNPPLASLMLHGTCVTSARSPASHPLLSWQACQKR